MTRSIIRHLFAGAALGALAISTGATAQDATPAEDGSQDEAIIVTGTLIRGIAPTGTNVVGVTRDDIVSSGATTANEILAEVPQVTTNFNRVRTLPAGASGVTNLTPNIRNFGASGATTTLVLVDGHRMVNAGVLSTSPDPDVIPPGVIERVDIVPDGGSSIYGSDAVGGVINFITRKRFDGVEVMGRYGFADNYSVVEANATAGSDWGSGSGYISYSFLHHDEIFGRDRDFFQQVSANGGQCNAGTVFVGNTPYALPNRTPGTITNCDITDNATLYPRETRHSIFGSLMQELSDAVTFELKAFYTRRETTGRADPNDNNSGGGGVSQVICAPTTPAAACAAAGGVPFAGYVAVAGDTGVQRVAFNYGGVINTKQTNNLDEFQITPSLTAELGGGWQLRALGSFGESSTEIFQQQPNATGQAAAIAAGTLNPYNPSATPATALATIFRNFIGTGTQRLVNGRLILDGELFQLPGGGVNVAVGAEFYRESLRDVVFGEFVPGTEQNATPVEGSRNIKSLFGELVVPIIGADNGFGGMQSLTFSASARYDHYSDFGGTFNPKFGLTFVPTDWLTIRGNWGKSFNAPSLADTNAPDTRSFSLPAFLALAPGVPPATAAQQLVVLVGGNPNLGPQKAKTWSIGADIDFPFAEGLRFSATYYNIHLTDQISFANPALFYTPLGANFSTLAPSRAVVEAAIGAAQPYLGTSLDVLYSPGFGGVYSLLDFRRNNLAEVKQDGLDFNLSYKADTSFGSVFGRVAGTHTFKRDTAAIAGAAFTDVLKSPGDSDFLVATTLGMASGGFKASATWKHTAGYDLDPVINTALFGTQSKVKSFNTVDLFFEYGTQGEGLLKDLTFTLNVENLFDQDPPFFGGNPTIGSFSGYTNGSTLGRMVLLGVKKKF